MKNYGLMNGYKFKYNRVENKALFSDDNQYSSKYIIELNIYNNIDILIYSIRMSESDCIRVIDELSKYLYDLFGLGEHCLIKLPMTNNRCTNLQFNNVAPKNGPVYIDSLNEEREHELVIVECQSDSSLQILKIYLSNTEVEELIFELYFNGLIDIALDFQQSAYVDEIIGRIFGSNWFNCN